MPLQRLQQARRKTIGTKQTAKAIEKGAAAVVFVARDADAFVIRDIVKACEAKNVQLTYVETMADLGKACGIAVGAASAAILAE